MPPLHVVENGNNSRSRIAAASSSALVVPVPVPCVLDVTQGSPLCRVEHAPAAAAATFPLSEGDLIRIHHPYHGANFEVSSCGASAITLTRPYDHAPITEREDSAKRFEGAIERLHCPYSSRKDGTGVDGDGDNIDDGSVRTAANSISPIPKRRLLEAAANDTGNTCTSESPAAPVNMTLLGTRVWRLVALESDKRSPWRRQYDDGDAPSDLTFDLKTMPAAEAEAEGTITHFRIPLQQSTIVAMCRDVPYDPERSIHQQRVQYFDCVAVEFVVRETYQAVCDWHPACSTIDNVKWAELRRKLKAKRERRDASIICRFARSLQGHQVVVTMCRHGVSDSDSHLLMRVYLPVVQKTFDFCFPEQTLQLYTQQILEREGCMSWKEMLKPEVLKGLVDRLMVRRVNGVPVVIFSKRNLAEKGRLIAKKLIRGDDNGGIYLLSIYKSTVDFTFCLYDPVSCDRIRTSLSHAALHKWLSDEARLVHNTNDYRSSQCPRYRSHPSLALLLPGRQGDLVEWLSTRLSVKTAPDTGHRRVLFQFEADREKAERLACRIQAVVRKLAARARARTMIREHFEKVFDRVYEKGRVSVEHMNSLQIQMGVLRDALPPKNFSRSNARPQLNERSALEELTKFPDSERVRA